VTVKTNKTKKCNKIETRATAHLLHGSFVQDCIFFGFIELHITVIRQKDNKYVIALRSFFLSSAPRSTSYTAKISHGPRDAAQPSQIHHLLVPAEEDTHPRRGRLVGRAGPGADLAEAAGGLRGDLCGSFGRRSAFGVGSAHALVAVEEEERPGVSISLNFDVPSWEQAPLLLSPRVR
jgi:hypothetical protein